MARAGEGQAVPSILIVEDDEHLREALADEFKARGYQVTSAPDAESLRGMGIGAPKFAVVDLRLGAAGATSGLDVVEAVLASAPSARIVVLTGYGSIASAVQAVRLGAVNYLTKPVKFENLERALWTDQPIGEVTEVETQSLARHEREYIEYVLAQCDGNITQAAKWLGLHRQSLQRKLRKFTP